MMRGMLRSLAVWDAVTLAQLHTIESLQYSRPARRIVFF
jgi:hypothetical protein